MGTLSINITEELYNYREKTLIGKGIYSLLIKIYRIFNLSIFPIESIDSYEEKYKTIETKNLIGERRGVAGVYSTFKKQKEQHLKDFKLPPIRLSIFSDVYFAGNSDVVVDMNNKCIINDLFYNINPQKEIADGLLYRQKNNVGILRSNMKHVERNLGSGIMVSGKYSFNYYHELFENLNRLLIIKDCDIPLDVPYLIDEKVMSVPSFKRVFEIMTENNKRDIILLNPKSIYSCSRLYYVDHINDISELIYDPILTIRFKEQLLKYKSQVNFPKRIFITRRIAKSRQYNEEEVFLLLSRWGFQKIAPEDYSFEEQMKIFSEAEWIVGGSGAAMTNLMFCSKGCKVICFRSSYLGEEPPIFNGIAYLNGCSYWYYEPNYSSNPKSIHSNYSIDIKELESIMEKFFNN